MSGKPLLELNNFQDKKNKASWVGEYMKQVCLIFSLFGSWKKAAVQAETTFCLFICLKT
jgi:hypothetical protein